AAVDDDRAQAGRLQQHHVLGEAALQRRIDHGGAAVLDDGAGAGELLDVAERLHHQRALLGQDPGELGAHGACPADSSRPMVSGSPNIRLAFCTACPAAPFTRLSMEANETTTPRPASALAPSTTLFVPSDACRVTSSGGTTRRKGRPSAKASSAFTAAAVASPATLVRRP